MAAGKSTFFEGATLGPQRGFYWNSNNLADPEPALVTRAPLEVVYGEKRKEPTKPPHHLLETQIFPALHKSNTLEVKPEQLSFVVQPGLSLSEIKPKIS